MFGAEANMLQEALLELVVETHRFPSSHLMTCVLSCFSLRPWINGTWPREHVFGSADYPKSERKWWEVKLMFHHNIFHPCLFRMIPLAGGNTAAGWTVLGISIVVSYCMH